MDEQDFDRTLQLVWLVMYAVAVAVVMLASFPSVRPNLVSLAGHQIAAWRYGRWLAGRTPPPAWTTLLARKDLPAEKA